MEVQDITSVLKSDAGKPVPPVSTGALYLLFGPGARPTACDVESSFVNLPVGGNAHDKGQDKNQDKASNSATGEGALNAMVIGAHGAGLGSLELLANGLSFDLVGLSPSSGFEIPEGRHFFGLPRDIANSSFEALVLQPGPHLAHAGAMIPVAKSMIALAADLANRLGALAVCWQPAGSWMDPGYFARISLAWGLHSVFPALGLTAITMQDDGALQSDGLTFFTGQDLRFLPRIGQAPAESVKFAVRIIDYLVSRGPVLLREDFTSPDGATVSLEPSSDGKIVKATCLR